MSILITPRQAIESLKLFHIVGVTERYDKFVSALHEQIGVDFELTRTNVTAETCGSTYLNIKNVPENVIATVERATKDDREIYEKAKRIAA